MLDFCPGDTISEEMWHTYNQLQITYLNKKEHACSQHVACTKNVFMRCNITITCGKLSRFFRSQEIAKNNLY
jgi:hypothetical protein